MDNATQNLKHWRKKKMKKSKGDTPNELKIKLLEEQLREERKEARAEIEGLLSAITRLSSEFQKLSEYAQYRERVHQRFVEEVARRG